MAALLGASFMAISAFYIHRRTVDQVLHRIIEIRRTRPTDEPDSISEENYDEDDYDDDMTAFEGGEEIETDTDERNYQRTLSRSVDENMNFLRTVRVSSSMPDVVSATEWFRDGRRNRSSSHENLHSVPIGLPSLRTRSKHGGNLKNLMHFFGFDFFLCGLNCDLCFGFGCREFSNFEFL